MKRKKPGKIEVSLEDVKMIMDKGYKYLGYYACSKTWIRIMTHLIEHIPTK